MIGVACVTFCASYSSIPNARSTSWDGFLTGSAASFLVREVAVADVAGFASDHRT